MGTTQSEIVYFCVYLVFLLVLYDCFSGQTMVILNIIISFNLRCDVIM